MQLRTAFCLKYLKNDICSIAGFEMGKGGAPSVRPAQAMQSLHTDHTLKNAMSCIQIDRIFPE